MNINYCVLEVAENGGLLVVYDFGGTYWQFRSQFRLRGWVLDF